MPPSSAALPTSRHMRSRNGACRPNSASLLGVLGAAILGLVIGFFAIRRQGIYFAMITLALAQMFAFFCLQASFTHGEDGIQGVPRGYLFGFIDLNQPLNMYFFVLAVFLIGMFIIWRIINSPFGMILNRPRKRTARDLAWLFGCTLQARCLRHVGGACRSCGWFEGNRLPVRHADRRQLADVWRSHPDDTARRHRHAGRTDLRRRACGRPGKLSRDFGVPGHRDHRHHLHGLRACVPARHHR